jgi:hypothetical protein
VAVPGVFLPCGNREGREKRGKMWEMMLARDQIAATIQEIAGRVKAGRSGGGGWLVRLSWIFLGGPQVKV